MIGGWNIKSFDVPYIFKKAIKYGVDPVFIPKGLQIFEKKPWETKLFDLSELWKMTGFQTQTLSTVCDFLGVQSPKEELEGKFVKNVYYNDYRDVPPYLNEPYERIRGYQTQSQEDRESLIVKYCEADVKSNIDIAKIIAPYF